MQLKLLAMALMAGLLAGCAGQYQPSKPAEKFPVRFLHGQSLKDVPYAELLTRMNEADVVFVGEIHDDSLTHIVEYHILEDLTALNHRRAVSLEMFERDVQALLNDYLYGAVSEEEFLAGSRPWTNYKADYRPLVEFARRKGLPVLAANIPRRYAALVARGGAAALEAVPDSEKVWIARQLKAPDGEYKKRFLEQMGGTDRPRAMGGINPENLYTAQCIKDDTMAETMAAFMRMNPETKMLAYQGDFHSAYGLGLVEKLKMLMPGANTVVISIVPVEGDWTVNDESWRGRGDYIIVLPRHKTER